jgi:hypothetical protein
MPGYLYCAVHRRADGTVGTTLHAQGDEAATADESIAQARRIDLALDALGANAMYLSAPEDGRAIWTLYKQRRHDERDGDGDPIGREGRQ